MNNSTLTIRTVGFRRLCRGYFRVLFPGFTLKKGVSLSPSWVDFGRFGFQLIYFIGVVDVMMRFGRSAFRIGSGDQRRR